SDLLTLSYTLGAESEVRFELVNMLGARVMNQYVGSQTAGSYSFHVDLSAVSSGFYLLNVEIDGVTSTLRVSVSK
ncbi:MAG: T9SS type A sorting domain-containing protein, partial [Bacteroidota bacterium]